jgi:hypothetical protein
MSVLDDVFASLRAMSLVQLLLAFVACTGYALAQGGLVSVKGRRAAWAFTVLAAIGFAFESAEWMYAAMLVSFAVAGLGVFVACAWLLSRALGFSKPRAVAEAVEFAASVDAGDSMAADFAPTPSQSMPLGARSRPPSHSDHAHSV